MDMSVKLNLTYQPVVPQNATPNNEPAARAKALEAVAPVAEPKRDELEKAVKDIREFVQASQRKLDFALDDSTGRVVVKVIATESGDVIRQIPSETALKLAQSLSEAGSLLFTDKA
ncbi:flagellar protein FlaG [compost metagenome]|uniref:flagellar protein FlaG n=1 Tax=Pseudomonas TaxID=286 RepID=UPI000418AE39|nr:MULTISPECIES: flagellar protein FlaG [Pseudomonas]PRA69517.1 flagellar biosynthesis protein FlaG [Pseudomonas sp. MYb187]